MAKLIFLPKNEVSTKLKLGMQYKGLKAWLLVSVCLNISLIGILTTILYYARKTI